MPEAVAVWDLPGAHPFPAVTPRTTDPQQARCVMRVDELQKVVANAIAKVGAREVARRLDISFESALRLASGEPIRRATERLARANLSALGSLHPRRVQQGASTPPQAK
jgi:hypothetical protein